MEKISKAAPILAFTGTALPPTVVVSIAIFDQVTIHYHANDPKSYKQLKDQGLSSNTIGKVHKILHAAMKKALHVGLIPRNIIDTVEAPKMAHSHEIITFSKDEITQILNAAQIFANGRYYVFFS